MEIRGPLGGVKAAGWGGGCGRPPRARPPGQALRNRTRPGRAARVPNPPHPGKGRLAGAAERARLGQAVEFAIESERNGSLAGSVLVFGLHERHRRCEVGFWIVPGARRCGHGRRAVALAIAWALGDLGVERVEMTTTHENQAIPGFAQRLGFTYEGCLRGRNRERGRRVDILWFGLLREEWAPSGAA